MLFEAGVAALLGISVLSAVDWEVFNKANNRMCNYSELKKLQGDGIKLSNGVQLNRKMTKEHVLFVAPSGQGKSRRFIMHNVKDLKNCSMIVTDPSREIERSIDRKDVITLTFNPRNPDSSIGFDPLQNCSDTFEVKQIMEVILNNSLATEQGDKANWLQMSLPLLKAYAVYNFYTKKYPFDNMIANILIKPIEAIEKEIEESEIVEARVEMRSFMQIAKSPQTLSCIRNTLTTALQIFHEYNVKQLCRKPTFDFKELRDKEAILLIQIPERYSDHYKILSSVLVQQIMDRLLDNPNGLDVYMLFDEFSNIGKISNINNYLSTARKHNLGIIACIQNLTQLQRNYGEIDGKELQELFKTVMVSGGLKDSNEYFTDLMGSRKVKKDNTEYDEPLMKPDELRRLDEDKVIILSKNKRPVRDNMLPIMV